MGKLLPTLLSIGCALLPVAAGTTACDRLRADSTIQQIENSPWELVGQLPTPLESHKMVLLGEFVYVIGGWNESKGIHEDVYFTRFSPDSPLDTWQKTTSLPLKLQHHEVILHGGAIYVLGGDNGFWDGSSVTDRIFRALPTAEGDITEWTEVGQLPAPLTTHAATLVGDQLYIIGGSPTFRPGDTPVVDTIFTAPISSGGVGPFQTLEPFPIPIGWVTATAVGQRIFAISGNTQFRPAAFADSVWVANVNPDQSLSPFEEISTITSRRRHATVLVDQTLVAIAGGGAQGALATVEAAEVDAQGNLSPWESLPPLPETRYAHAAFVHDSSLYVSGGFLRYGSNETSRKIFRLPLQEGGAAE